MLRQLPLNLPDAFLGFDKTNDGHLNKIEYVAAMKSLDFEDYPFEVQKFDKPCGLCGAENAMTRNLFIFWS